MSILKPQRVVLIPWLAGVVCLVGGSLQAAPLSFFLLLNAIKGEVQTKPYTDQIALQGYTWNLSAPTNAGSGNFESITFAKVVDKSSPLLYNALCTQSPIAGGLLTVQNGNALWMQFVFTNLYVTGVSTGLSTNGARLDESINVSFQSVQIIYYPPPRTRTINNQPLNESMAKEEAIAPDRSAQPIKSSLTYVKGSGKATLSWPATPGMQYTVLFTDSLSKPFAPLGTYEADGGVLSVEVPAGLLSGFFSIHQVSPIKASIKPPQQ